MRRLQMPWSDISRLPALAGCVAAAISLSAGAHDSWLLPLEAGIGGRPAFLFCTGEQFPTSDTITQAGRVRNWLAIAAEGQPQRLSDFQPHSAALAGVLTTGAAGPRAVQPQLIAIELFPRFIELPADRFEAYLRDEGAAAALAEFQRQGAGRIERERYTKFAKLIPGSSTDLPRGIVNQPVGHRIEIVPDENTGRFEVGKRGVFRLIVDGKPAAGLLIRAGRGGLELHTYAATAVTDAEGRTAFTFDRPGWWYLKAHTIRRVTTRSATTLPAGTGNPAIDPLPDADWESFWASLTVNVVLPMAMRGHEESHSVAGAAMMGSRAPTESICEHPPLPARLLFMRAIAS